MTDDAALDAREAAVLAEIEALEAEAARRRASLAETHDLRCRLAHFVAPQTEPAR